MVWEESLRVDRGTIALLETTLDEITYGEVTVVFHVRAGKVEWIDLGRLMKLKPQATGPPAR